MGAHYGAHPLRAPNSSQATLPPARLFGAPVHPHVVHAPPPAPLGARAPMVPLPHVHMAPHIAHVPVCSGAPPVSAHSAPNYYELYADAVSHARCLQETLDATRRELERARERVSQLERAKPDPPRVQSRYWTPDEHARFLEALGVHGAKDVRAIASFVGTRNATQVRTHAQKFFLRRAREAKGGSALQNARKRSMSESDLARVDRAHATPPGSPLPRELRFPLPKPLSKPPTGDTLMLNAPALPPPQPLPPPVPTFGAHVSSLTKPALSIPAMMNAAPPSSMHLSTHIESRFGRPSADKPPAPLPSTHSDNSGINLLSLVASEREMQSVNMRH